MKHSKTWHDVFLIFKIIIHFIIELAHFQCYFKSQLQSAFWCGKVDNLQSLSNNNVVKKRNILLLNDFFVTFAISTKFETYKLY